MKRLRFDIEKRIVRQSISSRGGGVEIHLSGLKNGKYNGHKMTAYQNYLGGGLLSSIGNDCTLSNWSDDNYLTRVAEYLAQYYHEQTNPDTEWEGATFKQLQQRPLSAY